MDKQILESMHEIADEFGSIAKKVNQSSRMRKGCAEEAISFIDQSMIIGEGLREKLSSVANEDIAMSNQNSIVLNTCLILKNNIEQQKKMIEDLNLSSSTNLEVLNSCLTKINYQFDAINEALSNIQAIIARGNDIILKDKQLLIRKQSQHDSLETLKEIALISLQNAESAIDGSSSNLDRGLKLVEKFKNVEELISVKNFLELNTLLEEANKGWNIAVDVNRSSISQFEFAEKVNKFTRQLHKDSLKIKDIVVQKHAEFENNLQVVTVLTVILSLKFKKYLQIEEDINSIDIKDDYRDLMNDFISSVKIACNDVKYLGAVNYDMADSSHLNNETEDSALKLTRREIEYYDGIKKEVEGMTEATRYPIEGSNKNITNGKNLEKYLKEVIDQM